MREEAQDFAESKERVDFLACDDIGCLPAASTGAGNLELLPTGVVVSIHRVIVSGASIAALHAGDRHSP